RDKVVKSAEEGSLDHVFILACMYMYGKGVDQNQASAFELFKSAANKGHSNSQNNLGYMFEEGVGTKKDLKQAFTWYKTPGDFNNPSAICNMGYMIEHGVGMPPNVEEGLKLYEKASSLGNQIARQNVMGFEFEKQRNWSIKGIEVGEQTPNTDAAAGKKVAPD